MKIKLILDGDKERIPGLAEAVQEGRIVNGKLIAISTLPAGMQSGKTSVAFVGELEDGRMAFMETSLRVFQTAAAGFTGKYGDETGELFAMSRWSGIRDDE